MARPGGRPRKFQSPKEMQEAIDAYFESCFRDEPKFVKVGKEYHVLYDGEGRPVTERVQHKPFTITGLALALDMSRQDLLNYEQREGYEAFFDTVKKAKARCENYVEEGMLQNTIHPASGCFNMKNNYGWKDQQDINIDATVRTVEQLLEEL